MSEKIKGQKKKDLAPCSPQEIVKPNNEATDQDNKKE